jgi:anti-sigma B factor antagonist
MAAVIDLSAEEDWRPPTMWKLFSRTSHASDTDRGKRTGAVPQLHVDDAPPADIATIDRVGQICIVTITCSELTMQNGGPQLAELLEELADRGDRYLVLDIQNVSFMDSCCVNCMVEALNRLVKYGEPGAAIALANPCSSVAHLFRITRLDRVFPMCADVLAAMNLLERRIHGD